MRYYLYLEKKDKLTIKNIVIGIVNSYIYNLKEFPEYKKYCPIETERDIDMTENHDFIRVSLHLRKRYNEHEAFRPTKNILPVYENKFIGEGCPTDNDTLIKMFRDICVTFACYYIYYFETGIENAPRDIISKSRWNKVDHPVFSSNVRERAEKYVDSVLAYEKRLEEEKEEGNK